MRNPFYAVNCVYLTTDIPNNKMTNDKSSIICFCLNKCKRWGRGNAAVVKETVTVSLVKLIAFNKVGYTAELSRVIGQEQ